MLGIVLIIIAFILFILPYWFTKVIALICFIVGIVFSIRSFKNFLFELIDHIKGTDTSASRGDYASEARRACERVTPKKGKNETPPWEE